MEFFLQIILQIILYPLLLIKDKNDHYYSLDDVGNRNRKDKSIIGSFFIYFLFGCIVGWLSLFLYPEFLIEEQQLRIIALFFIPLLTGLIMMILGLVFSNKKKNTTESDKFIYTFIFAFGISLVRFSLAD
ncbi:MAG: hypothetical protein R3D71_04960 [Rickettsiales bacterium]